MSFCAFCRLQISTRRPTCALVALDALQFRPCGAKTAYVGAVTRFHLVRKAERQLLTRKRDESAFLPFFG